MRPISFRSVWLIRPRDLAAMLGASLRNASVARPSGPSVRQRTPVHCMPTLALRPAQQRRLHLSHRLRLHGGQQRGSLLLQTRVVLPGSGGR